MAKAHIAHRSAVTILIADDDENDITLFDIACDKVCPLHTRRFVRNGEQAIKYLEGLPPFKSRAKFPFPNLLILDIEMPVRTGFDVLRWMKISGMNDLPAVILSGSTSKGAKATALELGAVEFYSKPTLLPQTIQLVEHICERWLSKAAIH